VSEVTTPIVIGLDVLLLPPLLLPLLPTLLPWVPPTVPELVDLAELLHADAATAATAASTRAFLLIPPVVFTGRNAITPVAGGAGQGNTSARNIR
jgi:hypothetical protein